MRTYPLLRHAGFIAIACLPFTASGQTTYTLSGQALMTEFARGEWDGKLSFPNVYCLTFPQPEKAKTLRKAYFNGRAIYLVDAFYADEMTAAIAISTIPEGQTAGDAMARIAQNERSNEARAKSAGVGYAVSERSTEFGPLVGIVARNAAPGDASGPFPLTRAFIPNPQRPIVTLAVHRLFARGPDRFEVALFQPAPKPTTTATEAEMTARLGAFADSMVTSLQACTASIPVRARSNDSPSSTNSVASDVLDRGAGALGGLNFMVGRFGRDCLSLVGRTETPQEFAGAWQKRNAAYLAAAERYMQRRLDEASAAGGQQQRDAVLRQLTAPAVESARKAVSLALDHGKKEENCRRVVKAIDSGDLDVSPKTAMFAEMQAMREWAERQ